MSVRARERWKPAEKESVNVEDEHQRGNVCKRGASPSLHLHADIAMGTADTSTLLMLNLIPSAPLPPGHRQPDQWTLLCVLCFHGRCRIVLT